MKQVSLEDIKINGMIPLSCVVSELELKDSFAYEVRLDADNIERMYFFRIRDKIINDEEWLSTHIICVDDEEYAVKMYRNKYGRKIIYFFSFDHGQQQAFYICNKTARRMIMDL